MNDDTSAQVHFEISNIQTLQLLALFHSGSGFM